MSQNCGCDNPGAYGETGRPHPDSALSETEGVVARFAAQADPSLQAGIMEKFGHMGPFANDGGLSISAATHDFLQRHLINADYGDGAPQDAPAEEE